jgi:acyl carrier protein
LEQEVTREEVYNRVGQILTDYLRLKPGEITPQSHVTNDLGADSLALVELGFKMMEAFGIGMVAPEDTLLIMDPLVDHIYAQMKP